MAHQWYAVYRRARGAMNSLNKTASSKLKGTHWLDKAMARSAQRESQAAAEEAGLDFAKEELNTFDAFLRRRKLRHHPRIVMGLKEWWAAATEGSGKAALEFEDYRAINRALFHVLLDDEDYDEADVDETAAEEWASLGSTSMNEKQFMDNMFELVDVSVPSLDVNAYTDLINTFSRGAAQSAMVGIGILYSRRGTNGTVGPAEDPRIPSGGSVSLDGIILDASGRPILGADGKPMRARVVPPSGSVRPDGIILDANGNPVLGEDGKPLRAEGGHAQMVQQQRLAAREASAAVEDAAAAVMQANVRGALTRVTQRPRAKKLGEGGERHFYNLGKGDNALRKWDYESGQLLKEIWTPAETVSTLNIRPYARARLETAGEPAPGANIRPIYPSEGLRAGTAHLKQKRLEPISLASIGAAPHLSPRTPKSPPRSPRKVEWTVPWSAVAASSHSTTDPLDADWIRAMGFASPCAIYSQAADMLPAISRSASSWTAPHAAGESSVDPHIEGNAAPSPMPGHTRMRIAVSLPNSPRQTHLRATAPSLPNSPRRAFRLQQLSGSVRELVSRQDSSSRLPPSPVQKLKPQTPAHFARAACSTADSIGFATTPSTSAFEAARSTPPRPADGAGDEDHKAQHQKRRFRRQPRTIHRPQWDAPVFSSSSFVVSTEIVSTEVQLGREP